MPQKKSPEDFFENPKVLHQKTPHNAGLSTSVESFLKTYFDAHEGHLPTAGLYNRVMQEVERPLLRTTLQAVTGNQKKAAAVLGINRNTLRKKMTELGIDAKEV